MDRYGYWSSDPGSNSKLTYGFIDYLLSSCSDFLLTDKIQQIATGEMHYRCLLYTSPSPRDKRQSRMPSSA